MTDPNEGGPHPETLATSDPAVLETEEPAEDLTLVAKAPTKSRNGRRG